MTEARLRMLSRSGQEMLFKQFLTAYHLSAGVPQAAESNHQRLAAMKEVFGFTDAEVQAWDTEARANVKDIGELLASLEQTHKPDPNTRH